MGASKFVAIPHLSAMVGEETIFEVEISMIDLVRCFDELFDRIGEGGRQVLAVC